MEYETYVFFINNKLLYYKIVMNGFQNPGIVSYVISLLCTCVNVVFICDLVPY